MTKDQRAVMQLLCELKIQSAISETQLEMNDRNKGGPIGDIPCAGELAFELMRRFEHFGLIEPAPKQESGE